MTHGVQSKTKSRQDEPSSLCWLTKCKQLCHGIAVLTQLYFRIHIAISTIRFGPYVHHQVGYSIRGKKTT